MREYNKKKYLRVTANCGLKGDPVREIVEREVLKTGKNQSEFVRDAILTMHSEDLDFKARKKAFLKRKYLELHNDVCFLVQEKKKLKEQLEELGATEDELYDLTK